MSVITPESQAFIDQWAQLFADNELENITEATFRAFATSVAQLRDQGQYRRVLLQGKGNSASALVKGEGDVQPGLLYAIVGTPDADDAAGLKGTWNGSEEEELVYVIGLAPNLFASIGCLVDRATNSTTPVRVDVRAGTYQALQGDVAPAPAGGFALLSADLATHTIVVARPTASSKNLADYCVLTAVPAVPTSGIFDSIFDKPLFV